MKKKELKDGLYELNIPVYGNKIKKTDISKVVADVDAAAIPFDFISQVIEFLKNKLKTATNAKPNIEKFNKYVKTHGHTNLMEFAKAAVNFFKKEKLGWDDLSVLQNKYNPKGYEILPATWLERQFEGESETIQKRLPQLLQKKK